MTALDTSVSVPALLAWHEHHDICQKAAAGAHLPAHVLVESFSVMTRLPAPHRVAGPTAHHLLRRWADGSSTLAASPSLQRRIVTLASEAGLAGGATYDALVGLTAAENGHRLLTRDARAVATYERLNIDFEIVDGGR